MIIGYVNVSDIRTKIASTLSSRNFRSIYAVRVALNKVFSSNHITFIKPVVKSKRSDIEDSCGVSVGYTTSDGKIEIVIEGMFLSCMRTWPTRTIDVLVEVIKHELVHRIQVIEQRYTDCDFDPIIDRIGYMCDPDEVEAFAHQAIAELEHTGFSVQEIVNGLESNDDLELAFNSPTYYEYVRLAVEEDRRDAFSLLKKTIKAGCGPLHPINFNYDN